MFRRLTLHKVPFSRRIGLCRSIMNQCRPSFSTKSTPTITPKTEDKQKDERKGNEQKDSKEESYDRKKLFLEWYDRNGLYVISGMMICGTGLYVAKRIANQINGYDRYRFNPVNVTLYTIFGGMWSAAGCLLVHGVGYVTILYPKPLFGGMFGVAAIWGGTHIFGLLHERKVIEKNKIAKEKQAEREAFRVRERELNIKICTLESKVKTLQDEKAKKTKD